MPTLVNPMDERVPDRRSPAPRLEQLDGRTLVLLDISKPRGREFLDRLAWSLTERFRVARIVRAVKPTYTRPANAALLETLVHADGVIEALAD